MALWLESAAPATAAPAITGAEVALVAVTKQFGTPTAPVKAVDGVSLTVPAGSAVALRGASGSGKSTLLHLIGGVETPDDGTIHVGGLDLTALSRRELSGFRRRVGLVFQRYHLLPALPALDNVLVPLLAGSGARHRAARALTALEQVGLAHRAAAFPSELSGGEQQRVAIARAIVGEPAVLLADEPTGSLDSASSKEILELLLALRAQLGTTLLIATHDDGVAACCDRTVWLRDGKLG